MEWEGIYVTGRKILAGQRSVKREVFSQRLSRTVKALACALVSPASAPCDELSLLISELPIQHCPSGVTGACSVTGRVCHCWASKEIEEQLLISAELRQTQKTSAPTGVYLGAKSGSDALSEVTLENCAQKLFRFQIVGAIMNYE